jgi:hypothetical protein
MRAVSKRLEVELALLSSPTHRLADGGVETERRLSRGKLIAES